MKNKLLSLLLVITLFATTISVALPTNNVATGEVIDGLLLNGDFSELSNGAPKNWRFSLSSQSGAKGSLEKDVTIKDGLTVNAVKITTTGEGTSTVVYNNTVKIEKNTSYTMSFWVKMKNIKGFKAYMFEPNYLDRNGNPQSNTNAQEGQNIYTYSYDNGSTRVCRTDVKHKWVVAETGTQIGDANGVSMFITRYTENNATNNLVLTPDFPQQARQGEWVQVVHTFETGNDSKHEANVAYSFGIPGAVDGEIWLADFKMSAEKSDVEDYFTPGVNDSTLGTVSKNVPLVTGQDADITAEPFGENVFEGWFVGDELISTDLKYTFKYDGNQPMYAARFRRADFGIDGSFENGYTKDQKVAQAVHEKNAGAADTDWSSTSFLGSELNNSNVVVDSHYGGTWRSAKVSADKAHTGNYSLRYHGAFGLVGYKYTGLAKNTEYILSVYVYPSTDVVSKVSAILVTPGDQSCIIKKQNGKYGPNNESALAHAYIDESTVAEGGWTKLEIKVNTKENTDIIFWLESGGSNDAVIYLDNFAIKRIPKAFEPAVNDSNLGYITPKGITCTTGEQVTVTATPVNDATFEGWYLGEELLSTEPELTFNFADEYLALTAKFKAGLNTLPDYSFENYTENEALAQSPNVAYGTTDTAGLWTPELYKTSSINPNFFIDSEWSQHGKVAATTAKAHSGKSSIKMTPNSRFMGYKLSGLNTNTNYTLSFYAMTDGTTDGKKDTLNSAIITDANQSCMVKNANNTLVQITEEAGALRKVSLSSTDFKNTWKQVSIRFNTKESTDVILWLRGEGGGTTLYLDDIAIEFTPKEFKPLSSNINLGTVTPAEYIQCKIGQSVTVTATPNGDDITFKGWYVGDEFISDKATFTFEYEDKYQGLTAVFAGVPGTIPNAGFEYNQVGQVLASYSNNNDPKFNNNAPWSVDTSYRTDTSLDFTVVNDIVHSGEKAGKLNVPYRYVGLDIDGLQPETEYLVSFWAHITGKEPEKEDDDPNPKSVTNVIVYPKGQTVLVDNGGSKPVQAPASLRLGTLDGPVECYNTWKKVSVIFTTTKDVKDVTVFITFSGLQANLYLDDFEIRLAPDKFKPVSNNSSLGYVTPEYNIYCDEGDSVTVSATEYPDSTFKGWYIGDEFINGEATFTFEYEAKYKGLTAKFEGTPGTIPNGGFEYFEKDQILASYSADGDPQFKNNPPWSIDTTYRTDNNLNIKVTNELVHSGEKAGLLATPYRYAGLDITGLNPGTEYMVSFWAHITGKEPDPDPALKQDQNPKNITSAFVLKKGQAVIVKNPENDKFTSIGRNHHLGSIDSQINCYNEWKKVDILFTTPEDSGDVTLWVTFSGYQAKLYLDDFSIGFGVKAGVSAELGGTVKSNFSSNYVTKGETVTIEAEPYEGNTFVGWFTSTGTLVSTEATYTFTAEEDFTYIARFDGYNKPATNLFAMGGKDGSFENGTVPGWFFYDPQYTSEWCSASVGSKVVYEGTKALDINGRYRNSILALTGLTPDSNYRLSFYINQPDTDTRARISHIAVIGSDYKHLGEANLIFAQTKEITSNSGWHKVDLYFNTGANVSANMLIRYVAETLSDGLDRIYIDNLSLYNYDASETVLNGDFSQGKANWIGDGTVAGGALNLAADETVYQDLAVEPFTAYEVSFKAKGKLTAAAQDLSKFDLDVKNYISSVSYVDVDGTTVTEYTYKVYTGIHQAMNFVFKANEGGATIDDFKVTKLVGTAGSIVEKIDFETERHELTQTSKDNGFDIVEDGNSVSGTKALKFTYDKATNNIDKILDEAWLSYMPGINNSIKLTMKYKLVKGKEAGAISIMPEYSGAYGGDSGFEHMAKNDDWQTINFFFNNITMGTFKTKIAAIADITESDFYIDDIVISITPPMVLEEGSKITYCEGLYNAITNGNFENAITDKDWANMPENVQVVSGDALKGSKFLRANGGAHYVVPFKVIAGREYYFAASVRGTANTVGSIGVTLDKEGNTYFANRNDQPASIVKFDSSEKGWKRSCFKITTDNSGIAYVVIDVDAGALDIDSVMMFTTDFGYRFDPNDYTVYEPYDFDNLQSPTTVINGGYGEQPYYKGVNN